ncbi:MULTISPECIES: LPS-assembly protein LptD [Halocynthiibacter]|uniref:LPS-assembly protein LptD n=1 Tax=Halocynthiibacter halioticoli TaxID=2986804 RepID=A0AAE3J3C6_9RHOB|nr:MULTISPECIES: LPS assembly protein LptD [Halocynthiibacter]MCV6824612.1 LPS assembly protein LptD [Halocynthiibacter halioticoli]MCW4057613.1 LPS assembly protein LptD [Halocynthiibacter sp. SDUM655004]
MTKFATIFAALFVWGAAALAQSSGASGSNDAAASLVADSLTVDEDGSLVADGNIEVVFQGRKLTADKITYSPKSDKLSITGPIRLSDGTNIRILAEAGELDSAFENGILTGARLVLNSRVQIASEQIQRVNGRYTQLYKSVASSCQTCLGNPTPLWEIRADRVTHDNIEKQIYFERAQFRFMGVPLAYIPNLRMPDPSVERYNGFLVPRAISDSNLGIGIATPYFITLGDSRDVTLTPIIATETTTLAVRYRQALRDGFITAEGAVSRDTLRPGETRAYLFADGDFKLPNDYKLALGIQLVSDRAYLLSYDFSNRDILVNDAKLSRVKRNNYVEGTIVDTYSLRDSVDNDTQPNLSADAIYERRFAPSGVGGQAYAKFTLHAHERKSNANVVGRDVARTSFEGNWQRSDVLFGGILGTAVADASFDFYGIDNDSNYPPNLSRSNATIGGEFRLPMQRFTSRGTSHLLEPVAQLLYTASSGEEPPNEDSTEAQLDEANLFSLSRFPGVDRRETGLRANIGLKYRQITASGWNFGATVGRVLWQEDTGLFNEGSGLDGIRSDWLAALELSLPNDLSFSSRNLINDGFRFTQSETLIEYDKGPLRLATGYIWLRPEPAIDRDTNVSEWNFLADYRVNDNWKAVTDWRYDFEAQSPARAGLSLTYTNECIEVDLSISRRFTFNDEVDPTTRFGFSLALLGFGDNNSSRKIRSNRCRV